MALKAAKSIPSRGSAPRRVANKHVLRGGAAHPLTSYTVLVTATNGLRIAGKRRAAGDVFSADPRHMAFLIREGVVGLTPAAPATATTSSSAASSSGTTAATPAATAKS